MSHETSGRFTVLDLMALIVAIAAGLAISKSLGDFSTVRRTVDVGFRVGEGGTSQIGVSTSDYMNRETAGYFQPKIKGQVIYWARQLYFWPGPCIAALSLSTLALGAGRTHRPFRQRFRGPGAVMSIAVLLALATAAVRLPNLLISVPQPAGPVGFRWAEWWLEFWFTVPRLAGFAVLVSWTTLALSGGWLKEGDWRNRLGLALGMAWIGMAAMDLMATWYHSLPF